MVGTLGWVWVGHHHVARCLRRLMLEAIACIEQDLFFSGQKMSFPPAFLPSSSTQMRRRSLIRMSCSHRRAREPGGAISSDVGMATEKLWAATSENHGPQTKNMFISQGCGLNWEYVPLLLKLATWFFFQAGKWQLQSCCNDDAMNKFVLNMAAVTSKIFLQEYPITNSRGWQRDETIVDGGGTTQTPLPRTGLKTKTPQLQSWRRRLHDARMAKGY